MQPLDGIRVLDFSTLLPGPFATLMLAEAGAEVIKVERPGRGEDMRKEPGAFALLNRGKRGIALDLKAPDAKEQLLPLLREADVLVEQFRPGVMDRLGLGYEALKEINPRLIYCSITGYGAHGPNAQRPGHDLTYQAEAGVLSLTCGSDGRAPIPSLLAADIAGGTYPAVINILLALRQRDRTGQGCRIDVAMFDNVFSLLPVELGAALVEQRWPRTGQEWSTGGSARYNIYRTRDARYIAVACTEPKFWSNFCATIGLASEFIDDRKDVQATMAAVAKIMESRDAGEWERIFDGLDLCCNIVKTLQEALASPAFQQRGLLAHQVGFGDAQSAALPVPIAPAFRVPPQVRCAPEVGEANDDFLSAD